MNRLARQGTTPTAFARWPTTTSLAALTAISLAIISLARADAAAAIVLGFVPAVVLDAVAAPPGLFLLPAWITPLTATLVHGGLLHLGLNLVLLVYCGRLLEPVIGSRATLLLYVVGAYFAAAGQWLLGPSSLVPMVGASGAVSAWLGAYAMLFAEQPVPRIGPIPARVIRAVWLGAAWVIIQLLVGFVSTTGGQAIAVGAHIGGFAAGLLLARPMLLWRYRRA